MRYVCCGGECKVLGEKVDGEGMCYGTEDLGLVGSGYWMG